MRFDEGEERAARAGGPGRAPPVFLLLDWPALEPQSTRPHMKKWRQSLRTAVAACARAV
jgi:hypothetical protein